MAGHHALILHETWTTSGVVRSQRYGYVFEVPRWKNPSTGVIYFDMDRMILIGMNRQEITRIDMDITLDIRTYYTYDL